MPIVPDSRRPGDFLKAADVNAIAEQSNRLVGFSHAGATTFSAGQLLELAQPLEAAPDPSVAVYVRNRIHQICEKNCDRDECTPLYLDGDVLPFGAVKLREREDPLYECVYPTSSGFSKVGITTGWLRHGHSEWIKWGGPAILCYDAEGVPTRYANQPPLPGDALLTDVVPGDRLGLQQGTMWGQWNPLGPFLVLGLIDADTTRTMLQKAGWIIWKSSTSEWVNVGNLPQTATFHLCVVKITGERGDAQAIQAARINGAYQVLKFGWMWNVYQDAVNPQKVHIDLR